MPARKMTEQEAAGYRMPTVYVGGEVLDIPEPDWLLRDFIQKGGLTVVYGEPGGGKSLVIQAWANILAAPGSSWAWVGRERAHRAEVLYIMAEGQGGLRGRLLAWQEHRAVEFLPGVRWMMSPFEVWRPPQEREFTEQQQEMLRYIEQEGIEVVFIDTLAATFGGGNENAQQDMNQYLQMCAAMQALGASVVIAHHAAKGSKTVRGSTVLHGAADTVILLDPNRSETTSEILSTELKLKKQKDGTPFAPITLRPKVYKVDTKAGESLVLHPGERDATVELRKQIIQVIKDNPGISKTQVREMDSIHGKNRVIGDIVDTLVDSGDVIKEGAGLTWDEAEAEEVTQI